MPGAIAIVIILVIAIPVGVLVSGAAVAGIIGWILKAEVDEEYEGTELLDIS